MDGSVAFTGGLGISRQWLARPQPKEWGPQVRVRVPPSIRCSRFSPRRTYTTGGSWPARVSIPRDETATGVSSPSDHGLARGRVLAGEDALLRRDPFGGKEHLYPERLLPARPAGPRRLVAAASAGEVKVMVPGDSDRPADGPLRPWSPYGAAEERRQDLRVQATMMHNKTMAVDGIFSTIAPSTSTRGR